MKSNHLLTFLFASSISLQAGGLYLYEVSTTETALAGAGWAARAQDATTVFSNPAGMTELEGRNLQSTLQPLYTPFEYEDDNGGKTDAKSWLPTGGLAYTHQLNDKWTVGAALGGYFGLALKYEEDWPGDYFTQEVTLQSISLQPTAAYRFNDQLSIGFGLSVLYGIYELKSLVPGLVEDSTLDFSDDVISYQANLGLLYKLNEQTRIGLQYFSESEQEYEDSFPDGPLINNVEVEMTLPQSLMASIFHQVDERLALMGNIGWQEWSTFGQIGLTTADGIANIATEADRNYDDTWNFALGLQYLLNEDWRINTGAAYDTAMAEDESVTVDLPSSDSIRYGIGASYQYSESLALDFAYEVIWYGDITVEQGEASGARGQVSGTYPDTALHFFSLGLNWHF
ncbi:MAG: OmpP1/FadL family transporter [Coraliomargaritaceae bacterium]